MSDIYYVVEDAGDTSDVDDDTQVATYRATGLTAGPWDPRLQHGGPPTALLVHRAEQAVARAGRRDVAARRVSVEFVGPVPVGSVQVRTRIVRAARSAVLVEAVLSAGDRTCLTGRVWFVARNDTSAVAPAASPRPVPARGSSLSSSFPYADSIEWVPTAGDIGTPGPGAVWARPRPQLVEGVGLAGLRLAAVVGDSASGISSELPWDEWNFVNVDLDVHLARELVGAWVHMDAATQLGPEGSALARSTLADAAGPVGATAQTLVLAPRR